MHKHDHHHGLARDRERLQSRRGALRWLGAGAVLALGGCGGGGGGGGDDAAAGTTSGASANGTSTSCSVIPSETAGPYPGDRTNNGGSGGLANALAQSGSVRSNIVSSFAGASGAASGVPLTVTLKVVNVSGNCASLAGYAVYLWHCDQLGRYSMYSSGVIGENYLRGVQTTDANGELTFTTIFPGCYDGRWPHIHFEVFSSLARATSGNNDVKTSQIALPAAACSAVYADSRYSGSSSNFSRVSLAGDDIFSDGATLETPAITGSVSAGYAITLQVGV
jgi:protocatechuate 3,4-dioxygenase beta subunit